MADASAWLWLWKPGEINWWIATLFMIGSALFALGCILFLAAVTHEFLLDSVFFAGSLFFTSAAYCQLRSSAKSDAENQSAPPTKPTRSIGYWASLSQFIGTLLFNMNTFDAFLNLGWIGQDLLIWIPDITGSILFQISGSLAMVEIFRQNKSEDQGSNNIDWWIGAINFIGCVAFLISAVLAISRAL